MHSSHMGVGGGGGFHSKHFNHFYFSILELFRGKSRNYNIGCFRIYLVKIFSQLELDLMFCHFDSV